VLIVLEGARPDYFSVPDIPHIRALMKSGTWYDSAWTGILESETPAGHAAIGTGSNPNRNGLLSFNWANVDNTSVDLFDPVAVQHGAMEAVMRAAHAPSIAGLVH
jgi:predicted AlkP superfamily pyrophosphatase or phosphodiesterase